MTSENAKVYLSKREIPRLFESLMTGLMYHQPTNHVDYLIDCLEKVKSTGLEGLRWNFFVELKRTKTPLPPITPDNGLQHHATPTPPQPSADELKPLNSNAPLPPIQSERFSVPKVPIIIVMGGPGCGKNTQAIQLSQKNKGWVHLSMGDIIRTEITKHSSAEEKWEMIAELVHRGELAPREIAEELLLRNLHEHQEAKGFIIEGYPRNLKQVEDFEKYIGRVDLVFLLDCEEQTLTQRLLKRGATSGRIDDNHNAIQKRILSFKEHALPVVKHFDDQEKVVILDGEREPDEVGYEMSMIFDKAFKGGKRTNDKLSQLVPSPPHSSKPASSRSRSRTPTEKATTEGNSASVPVEEIIEAPVARETASVTGGGGNPQHTAHLDSINLEIEEKDHQVNAAALKDAKVVFVLGGPGSGKGTQCAKLVERYGLTHLSSGDLLRAEVASRSERGKQLTKIMEKGDLVSLDVVLELLKEAMCAKATTSKGFLIDGYPRELEQGTRFENEITPCQFVLFFDASDEEMKSRLLERAKTSGRADDNEETIMKRLAMFHEVTQPVINHFESQDKVKKVESVGTVDDIFAHVVAIFDPVFNPDPEAALKKAKVIFVMGGPGSGKGTQCAKMVEKYGYTHLSSGDLLRECVSSGSDRGQMLKATMEKGELVSLDFVLELLKDAMLKCAGSKGFLIDGYPRELEQGKRFEKEIVPCTCVLSFEVDDEVMVERLIARGKTSGRVDDNEETIKNRLKVFHEQTLPVLDYYGAQRKVTTITAVGDVDEIFKKVSVFMDKLSQ